jgi:hypothetical protein
MAVYVFAYTEWRLVYLINALDPSKTVRVLAEQWSKQIATALRVALAAAELPEPLRALEVGNRWSDLLDVRNDIIHAHPATDRESGQRLHRWAPTQGRVAWVSTERLSAFIRDVEGVSRDANTIRVHLRLVATDGSNADGRSPAPGAD